MVTKRNRYQTLTYGPNGLTPAQLLALKRKVPRGTQQERTAILAYAEAFIKFLEDFMPEELDCSAVPGKYERLTGIYLLARTKRPELNGLPAATEDGDRAKFFLSAETLRQYAVYAKEWGAVSLTPGTKLDISRMRQEIDLNVLYIVKALKLDEQAVPANAGVAQG